MQFEWRAMEWNDKKINGEWRTRSGNETIYKSNYKIKNNFIHFIAAGFPFIASFHSHSIHQLHSAA